MTLQRNDTVALSEEGLKIFRGRPRNFKGTWAERTGTVLWTPRANGSGSVAVAWDGAQSEQYIHRSFLRKVEPDDQPAAG